MTAVAPVSQIRNLPEVQREHAITAYLSGARDALTHALEASGPEAVAAVKAEIATVAEMTKQLGLSKECRDDATEMVRRAEYALGKAIRKGQEEGTVRRSGDDTRTDLVSRNNYVAKSSPYDFASKQEMHGNGGGIYDLGAAGSDEFEEALIQARDEGNLTRKNVVRKIKAKSEPQGRADRAEIVATMAAEGHHRDQVARHLGLGRDAVNNIARDYGISFPADSVGKVRRADSARIVRETVNTLEGLLMALPLVNCDDLDPTEADEWTASLDRSLRELRRFNNKIKEAVL